MTMTRESHNQVPQRDSPKANIKLTNRRRSSASAKSKVIGEQEEELDSTTSEGLENDQGDADNEKIECLPNLGDYDTHLFAYLDDHDFANSTAVASSSDGNDDDDDDHASVLGEDLDDSSIEAEEEDAIRAEMYLRSRSSAIPGPVSLRKSSQSQHSLNDQLSRESGGSNSSDSSEAISDTSSWGNDFLEDYFDDSRNPHYQLNQAQVQDPNRFDTKFSNVFQTHTDQNGSENGDTSHWQHFFSSDEEVDQQKIELVNRSKHRRASRNRHDSKPGDGSDNGSTDDDMPLKGCGPLPAHQINKRETAEYIPSGDSTDEDDGVPPERKRKRARGTKAFEVLGTNSFSARPPILGSWKIKGDKNVGIIDGLTTRTLSPPTYNQHGTQSQLSGTSPGKTPNGLVETPRDSFEGFPDHDLSLIGDFTDFREDGTPRKETNGSYDTWNDDVYDESAEVSDLDLLELGDFINTENMSSDNDGGMYEFDLLLSGNERSSDTTPDLNSTQYLSQRQPRTPVVSPYLYRNRLSSKSVPISAFRNRGSPYVQNPAYPSENYSPAPRRRRSSANGKRPLLLRESYVSPANYKKRNKKSKGSLGTRRSLSTHSQQGLHHNQGGDNEHDFIGELVEIGAISPLFEVDQ